MDFRLRPFRCDKFYCLACTYISNVGHFLLVVLCMWSVFAVNNIISLIYIYSVAKRKYDDIWRCRLMSMCLIQVRCYQIRPITVWLTKRDQLQLKILFGCRTTQVWLIGLQLLKPYCNGKCECSSIFILIFALPIFCCDDTLPNLRSLLRRVHNAG